MSERCPDGSSENSQVEGFSEELYHQFLQLPPESQTTIGDQLTDLFIIQCLLTTGHDFGPGREVVEVDPFNVGKPLRYIRIGRQLYGCDEAGNITRYAGKIDPELDH
jgi:hypothetical protein